MGYLQKKTRVLLLGLDGACYDVIIPLIRKGRMKNLASLLKRGAWGDLETVIPPGSAQGWSSIYTGKNPGKHGVFEFFRRLKGSYKIVTIDSTTRDGAEIWDILGQNGKTVGLFNPPITYPPKEVQGFMVAGGFPLTPTEESEYTYPPSLKHELPKEVPGYDVGLSSARIYFSRKRLENFLHNTVRMKVKAVRYLMKRYDWDFFTIVFNETDVVQHYYWAYSDESYPVPKKHREKWRSVIAELYEEVDEAIGRIIEEAGSNVYVIFVSDHGAGPQYKLLDISMFLHKMGMLSIRYSLRTRIKRFLGTRILAPIILRALKSGRIWWFGRPPIGPFRPGSGDVEWSKTRAYSYMQDQIYVNLKGREPRGTVAPGKEYEEVRSSIIKELLLLKDPDNGERIVEKAWRGEDVFQGPHMGSAPDVVFLTRRGYSAHPYVLLGSSILTDAVRNTGAHTMRGIFLLNGPEVKAGRLEGLKVMDIAPTILYLMEVPIPMDMDGKLPKEAFTESFLKSKPVTYTPLVQTPPRRPSSLTPSEMKQIEDQLRALGYID